MNNLSDKVWAIFRDCLFTKAEAEDKALVATAVPAQGVRSLVGFHPGRLERHKSEIEALLQEMPDHFKVGKGASFLALCETKQGDQWGEHQNVEQLCQLGIAVGLVEIKMPTGDALTRGGMPMVRIYESWQKKIGSESTDGH